MPRIREHLATQAAEGVIGRAEEQAVLLKCLQPDGPHVVHLHGVAGVGKSTLLEAFAMAARRGGATIVRLDCRAVEPTETGFLRELSSAIGGDSASAEDATDRLGKLGDPVVVALDNYEVFRLMHGWLHQVFAPALPDNVRLVLVGREPPAAMWIAAPGWYGLSASLSLVRSSMKMHSSFFVALDSACQKHADSIASPAVIHWRCAWRLWQLPSGLA